MFVGRNQFECKITPIILILSTFIITSISQSMILIHDKNGTIKSRINCELAAFSPKKLVTRGYLMLLDPPNGCDQRMHSFYNYDKIAVVRRKECSFFEKAINAENSGFAGIVVYDPDAYDLIKMEKSRYDERIVRIEAMFVDHNGYKDLLEYSNKTQYIANFQESIEHSYEFYVFVFACVVGVFIIVIIVLIGIKLVLYYYRMWKLRLPNRQIKKIPIKNYQKIEDRYSDSCAICLEDFVEKVKVRQLPCNHLFHVKCIDPWLIKVHRLCPLCKIDVLEPERRDLESASSVPVEVVCRDVPQQNEEQNNII